MFTAPLHVRLVNMNEEADWIDPGVALTFPRREQALKDIWGGGLEEPR